MSCTQKQQLVCFPKVRVYKPWFRHFNDHKDFRNEGTVHLFSLMALFSYANFRSNERVINGDRYMEAPGQWICKIGALPRILRVHSKTQALELMEYFQNHGFLTFEILDEEKEILRFTIADWKEHCTHLQYNYYSYKGSGFFFFPLPVGRLLLKTARKEVGIVFSELDAIMDMWLHTILNDPKVRGSEYMPVVYYSNMRGMPLLSYTYLARRWGWSKSRVGRFMLKAGEYGIISRVSFSSSRGSVISMCRYREMIYGEGCEELELSRIGEIIGIAKAIDVVEADDSKLDISVESRVPPEKTIGKARKSLKIQVFLVVRSSFFARQIPLVFYSSLDWEMSEQEKSMQGSGTRSCWLWKTARWSRESWKADTSSRLEPTIASISSGNRSPRSRLNSQKSSSRPSSSLVMRSCLFRQESRFRYSGRAPKRMICLLCSLLD